MRPDLTIVVCAYNEIGLIEETYNDILGSLKDRTESAEIMFIDNGSTDGTREWLEKVEAPDVKIIYNETNLGKGGSVKKGIKLSAGSYVVIYDADFEYRAADIWKCYDCAQKNGASFVLGSRFLNSNVKIHDYHYLNYMGVKFLTLLINILYGCKLTDTATAIKLFNGDLIRNIVLDSNGFELDFELVARVSRAGGNILEVPAEYYPRTLAEGKKVRAFSDGYLSLKTILKNRFISRKRFIR